MVTSTEPEEIRLDIAESVSRLAVLVVTEIDQLDVAGLKKLDSLLSGFKLNPKGRLTPKQIHLIMAQIGSMYCEAIRSARNDRLKKRST